MDMTIEKRKMCSGRIGRHEVSQRVVINLLVDGQRSEKKYEYAFVVSVLCCFLLMTG